MPLQNGDLSVKEIAKRWGVTSVSVHQLINRNPRKLREHWIRNKRYVFIEDVEAWEKEPFNARRSRKAASSDENHVNDPKPAANGQIRAKKGQLSKAPVKGGNQAADSTCIAKIHVKRPDTFAVAERDENGVLIISNPLATKAKKGSSSNAPASEEELEKELAAECQRVIAERKKRGEAA